MKPRNFLITFFVLLTTISTLTSCNINIPNISDQPPKQELKEINGITYKLLTLPHPDTNEHTDLEIHTFIINPKLIKFNLHQNEDEKSASTINKLHKEKNAILTFNGIFFDEEFKPLGLLISDGKILSKYIKSGLSNGIFIIENKTPAVVTEKPQTAPEFAIQNGPILLDAKREIKFPTETNKYAARTAIGIDKQNNIVLLLIPRSLLNIDNEVTLHQFANILKNNNYFTEIGLHSVLNLDGGVSKGFKYQSLDEPEINKVQNIIYLTAQSQ